MPLSDAERQRRFRERVMGLAASVNLRDACAACRPNLPFGIPRTINGSVADHFIRVERGFVSRAEARRLMKERGAAQGVGRGRGVRLDEPRDGGA